MVFVNDDAGDLKWAHFYEDRKVWYMHKKAKYKYMHSTEVWTKWSGLIYENTQTIEG